MRLRFTLPNGEFTGELYANPVADDLAAHLPLEVTFSDYKGVEKVADLPHPLRVEGVRPVPNRHPARSATTHPRRPSCCITVTWGGGPESLGSDASTFLSMPCGNFPTARLSVSTATTRNPETALIPITDPLPSRHGAAP